MMLAMILASVSVGLYLYAMTLPAFEGVGVRGDPPTTSNSDLMLMIGWLGLLLGDGAAISWLANPLLAATWVLIALRQRVPALLTSAAAVVVCASALVLRDYTGDEAGGPKSAAKVLVFYSGYWLWLASTVVAFTAALAVRVKVAKPVAGV